MSAPMPPSAPQTLQWLHAWSEQGWLRRLDSALAAELLRCDPQAPAAVLAAAAVLAHMEGRGHTCLPLAALCPHPQAWLAWPAAAVQGSQGLLALWAHMPATPAQWLAALPGPTVRALGAPDRGEPLVLGGTPEAPLLYLRRYAAYEQRVGQGLLDRAAAPLPVPPALARAWLARLFGEGAASPDWQQLACAAALRARLAVITGGPGTGKTYTAARLLALLLALHEGPQPLRVALAAPTGKAAARLKQSIDQALGQLDLPADAGLDLPALVERMGPARTLHALLGVQPHSRRFRHHAAQPLDLDVLIVDEASMVHLEMMDALLQALPAHARLVLLGDKDQLASVEAGAVLGALCRDAAEGHYSEATVAELLALSGQQVPPAQCAQGPAPVVAQQTVMLRESRRFKGAIGRLALAVNRGDAAQARAELASAEAGEGALPLWAPPLAQWPLARVVRAIALGETGKPSYADSLGALQPPEGEAAHAQWVRARLQAFDRLRILCAVRQGEWGVDGLNRAVQSVLTEQGLIRPQGEWFAGRPVMVTRNDPQLGVFNGDVGLVLPNAQGQLRVWFLDGEALRSVSVMRLPAVETAFAMTVHKSQGSEFAHAVLVLPPGGAEHLSRELVYTGITRAREQFTLLEAEPGTLEAALAQPAARASGLRHWWA